MTRGEIKTYTTGKLGITDATALAQAELFTINRWRMIWNKAKWRQSRYQQNLSVPAGTQDVTLDSLFELVSTCRWADSYELLAMSDVSALATNPAGYDQAGAVTSFVPLGKDSSGNVVIRLMHKPDQTKNLLVIGKRKCVDLAADSDSPMIPGADQALCEYVMGDLYQWLRQLGKAEPFFVKGDDRLAEMLRLETEQAGEIRRIIPVEQMLDGDLSSDWLR